MGKFQEWLNKQKSEVKTTIAVIIGLLVVIFGGWNIAIAIKDFGGRKMKEGLKALGYAALIIFLGLIGYAGLSSLVNMIAPDASVIPRS